MNNENLLTGTRRGRAIIVIGALFAIAIVVLIVLIATGVIKVGDNKSGIPSDEERISTEVDPVSGETIRDVKQDRELKDGQILMIGIYQLKKMGLMADQYSKLVNTLAQYVSKNRPEVKQISYKKDSYKYTNPKRTTMYFMFVTNEGESFDVNMDTKGSIKDIDIVIKKHEDS